MKTLTAIAGLILSLAAHAGFDEGMQAYQRGDYAEAISEFRPLAAQGDPRAMYYMGFLYHYGYGVSRDQAEAVKWFVLAADRGDILSEYYLGVIYETGDGMERDLVTAHMWLSLYAANAPNYRDQVRTREVIANLERKMTEEQITRAKELAGNWRPQKIHP